MNAEKHMNGWMDLDWWRASFIIYHSLASLAHEHLLMYDIDFKFKLLTMNTILHSSGFIVYFFFRLNSENSRLENNNNWIWLANEWLLFIEIKHTYVQCGAHERRHACMMAIRINILLLANTFDEEKFYVIECLSIVKGDFCVGLSMQCILLIYFEIDRHIPHCCCGRGTKNIEPVIWLQFGITFRFLLVTMAIICLDVLVYCL